MLLNNRVSPKWIILLIVITPAFNYILKYFYEVYLNLTILVAFPLLILLFIDMVFYGIKKKWLTAKFLILIFVIFVLLEVFYLNNLNFSELRSIG